ncbi:MAG: HrcA family transcriptional regulator, partial [Fervidobacterium sp.]
VQHNNSIDTQQIENLLNKVMKNLTLNEFKSRLRDILLRVTELKDVDFSTFGKDFLEIAEKLSVERYEDYITEGMYNLISNQRINFKKLQNILSYVSTEVFYKDVFELNNDIYIGREHGLRFLDDFSIIIDEFKVENSPVGRVAVIFDKFDNYDQILDSFEFMINRLTEYFTVVSRNI